MSTRASARQEAAINKAGVEARHSNLTATPSPNGNKKSTVNNGSTSEPVRSLQAKKTEEPNSQTPDLGGAAKRKRIARKAKQAASTPFDDSDILPHGLGRAGDWTMDDGAAKDDNQGMVDSTKVQEYLNTRSKCGRRAGAITTKSLESSVKPDPIATESLDTRPPKNRRKTTKVKKEDDAADDEYEAVKGKRKRASAKDISQDISNEVEEPAETTVTPAKKQRKRKSNKYGLTPGESPFPEFPMPSIEACEEVNRLLTELHGEYKPPSVIPPPSMEVTGCGEVPDLLEAILRTLLSASTTANNANLAFDGLVKKFGRTTGSSHTKSLNWEAVRQADLETVIESIKRGGLAKVKATNMKKILDTVYQQNCTRRHALLEEKRSGKQADIVGASHESVRGKESEMSRTESDMLSLDHIFELTTDEAMEEMTKLPGIGVKTSSCVILFCMKRPSFAVDTHVWRHCKWLGWVPPKATRDQTFSHCEVKVPDHLKYSLHQLFLQHGKKCARCRANTSAGTDEWQSAVCPLEHLVNRNEKRKQVISTPVKKVKIALSDKKDVQVKVFDDIEESEIEMQVESEPDQDSEYKPPCSTAAVWTILAGLALGGLVCFVKWCRAEPVFSYTVPAPSIVANAKILEQPSIKAPGSTAIQCYAPATGQFLGFVNPSTPEGIDRAIERAHIAQETWTQTSFCKRRQVLRCIRAFVVNNQDEICRVACLDSGKTMIDAALGETLVTVEKLSWTIKHGEKVLQPSRRGTNLLMAYKKNTVYYEPLGVVAALVSWNYPFHNMLGPIISAIFAGNGIVVKVSENTAWSCNYFGMIAKCALQACGCDPNLIQVIACWPQTANHLTSHSGISHITFIGSRPVARMVAASASKALIPVLAELGGKDAAIILDSAEKKLPCITDILLRGTFQSAGQNCIGIERIIATSKIYDKVVQALEPRIRALTVGSVLDAKKGEHIDVGAMVSCASFERLEGLIRSGVEDGARLLVGGSRLNHPVHPSGHYFQPTLLVDVTLKMAIANEECFAPICVVMRATDTEDACTIANSPDFGLGASVFGSDQQELQYVTRRLKTGMVAMNDFAVYYVVQMPFGGVGGSGYGRFGGEEGLRGVCNLKAVCEDRWAWAGIHTAIPAVLNYPLANTERAWAFTKGLVELGYGEGFRAMGQGILRMMGW